MNLSRNWLSDFVDVQDISSKDYCDRMTDTGSKVECFEELGNDIENVVVAKIIKITPHENSDHLQICQVDIGNGNITQIVTGAQNVFEGAIVPAAIPVAKLPGDIVIKDGKLRGVESHGMLCSMGELNLTEHDMPGKEPNGILILDECYEKMIGKDIKEALMLSDTVVEFEITSNRPDCLSVIGLARETAVSFDRPLKLHTPVVKGVKDGDKIGNYLSVNIDAPDLCYRYMARVVKNVKIEPSPLWLRMRLRASGVRPINNIVDITNYIMLEYGQPMHAFDYSCLNGSSIIVRRANDGERFMSLDDQEHTLDSNMLVIADKDRAVALAGVMGGANSEIKDTTTTVVFESACFNGASVRVTAKKNGMRTESSARFEKGLDAENCFGGLERACELVEMLGAGEVVDELIDVYPTKAESVVLDFDPDRINSFLGTDISYDSMKATLEALDVKVDGNKLIIPSFRADLGCMNDIAEEIARIYGYNNIVSTQIRGEMTQGGRTPKQQFEVDLENAMCGMGADQIQTFSFISPKYYDKIRLAKESTLRNSVVISNPLGEDTSVMRTTSLPSMLEIIARNYNFNNEDVRLFEIATVYIPTTPETLPNENKTVSIGMYGNCDFFTLKGICENVLKVAGINKYAIRSEANSDSYHPGRCARMYVGNREIGILGQVHPLVMQNYGVDCDVYAAELDFDAIFELMATEKLYTPLPKFPATTRDFSFVCDEDIEVGSIQEEMAKAGGKLVENIALFDIYRGPQVGENKKSVSIRVTLRASDRTLTVEEAEKASTKILNALNKQFNITLRA
ncbi:MAG: phenylalanine--tRNA ligase subunit beta [Ruminococcaceae bacterium]|nr:phenylalanine--tRNA ligase subunit beta [Oscillospiraceae bacterium]